MDLGARAVEHQAEGRAIVVRFPLRLTMRRTARELAVAVSATLEGDAEVEIGGVAAPERAGTRDLIYVESAKHAQRAAASASIIAIAAEGIALPGKTVLRSAQPKMAFARAAELLLGRTPIASGIHPTARIAEGVKLDNLVHVGHDCQIGAHTVIAAQAGLSGSCLVGKRVVVGGQAGFGKRCKLEDGSVIGGQSGVLGGKTVRSGQTVWGTPARSLAKFKELFAWYGRLPQLAARIEGLEEKLGGK